jgi:hypothetical protein
VPVKGKKAAKKVLKKLEEEHKEVIPELLAEIPGLPALSTGQGQFALNPGEADAFVMTRGDLPTGVSVYEKLRDPLSLLRHRISNENQRPSDDLKRDICELVGQGIPIATAFQAFGVSLNSYKQWLYYAQQALDINIHDDFRELFEAVSIAVAQAQAKMFLQARLDPDNTLDLLRMRWPTVFGKHAGATPDTVLDYSKQVLEQTSEEEMAYTLSIFQQVSMQVGMGPVVDVTAEPAAAEKEPEQEKFSL